MKKMNLLLASAAVVMMAGSASAATLTFNGGSEIASLPSGFGPLRDANGAVATPSNLTAPLTAFTNADNSSGDGLLASTTEEGADIRITLTYLGFEAGNFNRGGIVGAGPDGGVFRSTTSVTGDSYTFDIAGSSIGTAIDLFFRTDGLFSQGCNSIRNGVYNTNQGSGCKLAFSDTFGENDNMTYAMFGDGAGDSDLDDLVFQVSVASVPLPAAGWFLLAGLGGMAAMRRKQK